MRHLLFLTVSATALSLGSAAQAACISALPDVTCSGTTTGGFTDATSGLVITVTPGATVENADGDAFRVRGDTITLTNDGTSSASGDAIDSQGGTSGLTVTNNGTITAEDRGVDARVKTNVAVVNSGEMTIGDGGTDTGDGIDTGNVATITNSGTIRMISGDTKAIDVGDGSTVTNSGSILSDEDEVEGIETGSDSTITNSGTIRVSDDALAHDRTLANAGEIEATGGGDGIDIDSGTITNTATGRILSANSSGIDYDASVVAVSTIDNAGLIRGVVGVEVELGLGPDPANTVGQHVINRSGGTIEGTGGMALVLGAGMDVVRLFAGSQLVGTTDLGADDDRLEFVGTDFGTGSFAGLFDGGAGFDTVSFDFSVTSVSQVVLAGQVLSFTFADQPALDGLRLANFESFAFADASFSRGALLQAVPSIVPLPTAAWLLIGGLAGLAGLRRRRT